MDPLENPARARFLRDALAVAAAALMPPPSRGASSSAAATIGQRVVPSSRELLPVIGCGTWIGFDVADDSQAFDALLEVVRVLLNTGHAVLDSSPMYGRSERVTGRLLENVPDHAFIATKVWTRGREAGIRQMNESIALLGRVDLMQVHNLVDWRTHLPTLRAWKEQGRIRHIGVTHYTASAYGELEAVLRAEPLDFVQVNYAIDDREAADRILPLAAERGIAVLVNRPFGGGGLLKRLGRQPLPGWAGEIGATSWAQVLLKFVLSHPAVTCAIPGTGNPLHMADNIAAGRGVIPDPAFWNSRIATIVA